MTQTARVVKAARSYRGICQTDFLTPVCDGGPPITRLAARIFDAERQGHVFEVIGTRNKCRVYRLLSEPVAVGQAVGMPSAESSCPEKVPSTVADGLSSSPGQLFEVPAVQQGHYDESEAA